jgi:hypothetical protein
MTVLLPAWRKVAAQNATALEGIALKDLHHALKLDAFARELNLVQIVRPWDAIRQYASTVVGSALACTLYDAGWKIETEPGVLWPTRDVVRLNPFQVVSRIASGELQAQEWNETIASSGLDPSMPLAPTRRFIRGFTPEQRRCWICHPGVPFLRNFLQSRGLSCRCAKNLLFKLSC